MQPWKEIHYSRVQEFTGLLADAIAAAPRQAPAPTPESSVAAPVPSSEPTPPASRPTASATFGKIRWKK